MIAEERAPDGRADGATPGQRAVARTSESPPEDAVLRSAAQTGPEERLANALGWLSLGLGLAGVAAPGQIARMIGVSDDGGSRAVLRAVGLREIASGVGILTQRRPAGWLWSRVAGDMMDLALLGKALASEDSDRGRVAAATVAIAGVTAVDLVASRQVSRSADEYAAPPGVVQRVKSVTIMRAPEEVYSFWRDFSNLPRFMNNLDSVEVLDDNRSHWRAKGPAGTTVEWDAEVTEDRPNEAIGWRSLPGADLDNWGQVVFRPAPGDRGTEVRVELEFRAPAGKLGAAAARLLGKEPGQELAEDLRTLKQVLETGEVIRSYASLAGIGFPQRPGQPPQGGAR